MKQVQLFGPNDLRVVDVPEPKADAEDVVVRVEAFGICGSDLKFKHTGKIGPRASDPLPLGHEFVGTIVEVGSDVPKLTPGMRVAVDPIEEGNAIGTGSTQGAYGEYVLVKKARLNAPIYPLPDGLSFERAVLTEPVAVATHAVNQSEFKRGERAVVFGAGPIGLAAIAVLKYRGAERIAAVDIIPERLERAQRLGAHAVVDARAGELRESLMQAMGEVTARGMRCADSDVFLDCAGAPGILDDIVHVAAARRARVVIVAGGGNREELNIGQLMGRELTIRGSMCYPNEFTEVLDMLADPAFDIEPMISHRIPFAEFDRAMAAAEDPRQSAKVVVQVA